VVRAAPRAVKLALGFRGNHKVRGLVEALLIAEREK
jgi:hypothetical protein